ncbi:MAG: FeoA family protein [Rhodospirillales bacterium]|jgi:ferrous iron transport protein A|nr:FeoA family protein [Rhodospirillales bacterium]|tara:strand:- start:62 stop:328 length:267 start_codon:yes stop_codon:yes gene_type:complete
MDEIGIRLDHDTTLAELEPGESGVINRIRSGGSLKRRLNAMGLVEGTEISLDHTAPMGDPKAYSLLGYQLSLRNEDARKIILRHRNGK